MRRRDEFTAQPVLAPFRVTHPVNGQQHPFDLEDQALGFAADLAVVHAARADTDRRRWTGVRVDYPTGAVVELYARTVRGASR